MHSCAALAEFIAPSHLPGFHKLDAAQQTRVEDAFKVHNHSSPKGGLRHRQQILHQAFDYLLITEFSDR